MRCLAFSDVETVKFPGSKLLHHWDLATQKLSLEDLLRSCQQVGLTGFAEVKLPHAAAMIFYYLGGEVNALYREGAVAYHGQAALERLRAQVDSEEGSISVYELPLDMAHLLRGITNRQKLKETVTSRSELVELLNRMEKSEHTGTLEVQTGQGAAMILLVRGRVSNTYWETSGGLTYEKGEARQRLEESFARAEPPQLFLSEFSRDIWKTRHEVQESVRSRLERREENKQVATDQIAAEESSLRKQVLDELSAQVPSLIQAFLFDLMTGSVLARKGRGTAAIRVGLLAEKVPSLTLFLRNLVMTEDEDEVELIEFSTERVATLIAIVPEALEGIAVLADKSQPTALIAAALSRSVRGYAARLHPSRGAMPASGFGGV
jgi:hypothetical protein